MIQIEILIEDAVLKQRISKALYRNFNQWKANSISKLIHASIEDHIETRFCFTTMSNLMLDENYTCFARKGQTPFHDNIKYIVVEQNTQSCIEAIKMGVFDYLVIDQFERDFPSLIKRMIAVTALGNLETDKKLLLKIGNENIRQSFKNIMYIQGDGSYSTIVTRDKHYTLSKTIKYLAMTFPKYFVRIHRSYLVNFNWVEQFNSDEVVLFNGAKLKIARSYKNELIEQIKHLI